MVQKEICVECGSDVIVVSHGETVCGVCGLVLGEHRLSKSPEYVAFSVEEANVKSRLGMPESFGFHDKGLPTSISLFNRDASHRRLSSANCLTMTRLRKLHERNRAIGKERSLAKGCSYLQIFSDKLNLPDLVRDSAALLLRRCFAKGLVRGRSIEVISAACIYFACRNADYTRSLTDVAVATGLSKKDVSRSFRFLILCLGYKRPELVSIQDYVSKYAAHLGISGRLQGDAIRLVSLVSSRYKAGKDPRGVACSALYIICMMEGEPVTENVLAKVADLTEVTLRNRYKSMLYDLGMLRRGA